MGQLLQTLLRILLCLVALNTSASQAQPLFNLDDHFTFNPQGKYQPRLIGLFETDRNNTSGAAEVITPVFQDSHGMFFADVRSGNSSDAVYLISAGGGLRHFVRPNLIGSTYIFMNYKEDYERGPATAVTRASSFWQITMRLASTHNSRQAKSVFWNQNRVAQTNAKALLSSTFQERLATTSPELRIWGSASASMQEAFIEPPTTLKR
ncbi:hypothetical protein [Pseudovibrio sp. WM33]|uniref:hypothetical protein n=1 Tax=Pseudovibrio sp. WM33 TaxID=1735585 RepID=UPI0007B31635|nr:hypothetical protein [Pseudovibrio sp. WM33]KZL20254.1 hypothetical protein PsWM33_04333 [Pseudovibrio sp. WM33]